MEKKASYPLVLSAFPGWKSMTQRVLKDSKKPGEGVSTLRGKVEKKKERSWRVTVSGMKGYFQNLYITSFLIYKLL